MFRVCASCASFFIIYAEIDVSRGGLKSNLEWPILRTKICAHFGLVSVCVCVDVPTVGDADGGR